MQGKLREIHKHAQTTVGKLCECFYKQVKVIKAGKNCIFCNSKHFHGVTTNARA